LVTFFFILSYFFCEEKRVSNLDTLISIYNDYDISQTLLVDSCIISEETKLLFAGIDIYGRNQYLLDSALVSWELMGKEAEKLGLKLFLVSGYRSYAYQAGIIKRKIDRGIMIEDILKFNKLPGLSEHHSGRAIDISNDKNTGLSITFENTEEYLWLLENAENFGFRLTYKKDNSFDIMFEPWHWYYYK